MEGEVVWVEAAAAGDHGAFARLVERYQRPVFSLCHRMLGSPGEAEDAAQETFLKAYRALGAYDPGRPFATWLLAIASHHCIDRLRRRRLTEVSFDALPPWRWLASGDLDPEKAAADALRADHIGALLADLPDDYRVVVVLRYWHDLGYAEIAEMLGESESAIKSRLHRARRQLAACIREPAGGEPAGATNGRPERRAEKGDVTWTVAQLAN